MKKNNPIQKKKKKPEVDPQTLKKKKRKSRGKTEVMELTANPL